MKRTRSAVTSVAFSNRTPFAPFSDAGCGTTAGEEDRLRERRVQSGEPRELRRLVDAVHAGRAPVDLLEAGEVRIFRADASRRPGDVKFSVHTRAMEHVEAHQLHLRGIRETRQRANQRDRSHHQFFMSSNTSIVRP